MASRFDMKAKLHQHLISTISKSSYLGPHTRLRGVLNPFFVLFSPGRIVQFWNFFGIGSQCKLTLGLEILSYQHVQTGRLVLEKFPTIRLHLGLGARNMGSKTPPK